MAAAGYSRVDEMDKQDLDRASVFFNRQSAPPNRQPRYEDKTDSTPCCFGLLSFKTLGRPAPDKRENCGHVAYGEPKALKTMRPCKEWSLLEEDQKCNLKCESGSNVKENAPGWINQDAILAVILPKGPDGASRFLFGVFDGHGSKGHVAAQLAAKRLPSHLAIQPTVMSNPGKALEAAVVSTDEDIFTNLGREAEFSGCTCVCALVDLSIGQVHCANVGDSRAVLGRKSPSGWDTIQLTEDCRPDLPEEKDRIELQGGHVARLMHNGELSGPPRVWEDQSCTKPGLAVSRSLGDGCARSCGVTPKPVITRHKLQPQDKFLIFASDGIWDAMTSHEAVDLAGKYTKIPHVAPKALIEKSRRHDGGTLTDDTTAVFVSLDGWRTS